MSGAGGVHNRDLTTPLMNSEQLNDVLVLEKFCHPDEDALGSLQFVGGAVRTPRYPPRAFGPWA